MAAVAVTVRRAHPVVALLLNATAAVLVSPISWSHHWVWIAPALLAAVGAVFVLAPFRHLPSFDRPGQEWPPDQHWIGNAYVLTGVVAVVSALVAAQASSANPPSGSDSPVSTEDPGAG
ncbi:MULTISPECIES: hypothetical protein [Amycolatopsis]|uniref:Alpha-1,2-mannosyltransferase n=2 Tax=Amycolatopsis TaxID=1813 RepID=A0A1I4C5A4_9PSEU|nr:hypothetical protein [Amycolatopsis sacchari]SFK76298.1 alpha-1,2-mannosyltransferase [Amycolatopsis sacchari]